MNTLTDNSNRLLEEADLYVTTPRREDFADHVDNDELIARINSIESPRERILCLFKSIVDFRTSPSHEAIMIRTMFLTGACGGFVLGGILLSPEIHEKYVRSHNSAVFEGKYVGNRHFWDTLITGCAGKGIRYGLRTSIAVGTAGLIGFSSVTYRNQLYYPDFLVGYSIFGALSRLWVGPRAMLAGGVFGAVVGSLGWACFRLQELSTGLTVTQLRLLNHNQYLKNREEKHRKLLRAQEEAHLEYAKGTLDT